MLFLYLLLSCLFFQILSCFIVAMSSHEADLAPSLGDGADGGSSDQGKRWKLKDGTTMTIGSYGKKRPQDKHMVIDLVFRFKNDQNPQIVGKMTI